MAAALFTLSTACLLGLAQASDNGLARTPPMGWNPYNCLSSRRPEDLAGCWPATESVLKASAMALKSSGLQALGYEYVNLDAGWGLKSRDNKTGRVQWNPQMFPSGIPALSVWLQQHGFRFGINIYLYLCIYSEFCF